MLVLTTQITLSGDSEVKTLNDVLEQPFGEQSVLTFDGKKTTYSEIVNTRVCSSHDFVYIKTSSGDTLVMTPDQKVYDPVKKEWTKSGELNKSASLLHADNAPVEVEDLHTIHDQMASKVCTLTIAETQCYFANNILVHNIG